MALILALYDESDFYVQDTRVTVHKIYDTRRFKLKVHGSCLDKIFEITDRQQTEILPNVRVTAGNNVDPKKIMVKVSIEAPKRLKILRGKLWRENNR